MLSQRRISPTMAPKAPLRSPSKSLLSPKGVSRPSFRRPAGTAPKVPLRGPSKALLSPSGARGVPSRSMKKAPPKAPTSMFGERKHWSKTGRGGLTERIKKLSPFIVKGKTFKRLERTKMIEQWFPHKRFGTHITDRDVKIRLRELRRAEHGAKSAGRTNEYKTYKYQKRLLEAFTGVKKY